MSITRGDCPFCGATKVSIDDEHVFPQWSIRLLLRHRGKNAKYTMRSSLGTQMREFLTKYPELVVHGPCKKVCNNGWMRELENRVRPFLGPMMATAQLTFLDDIKAPTLALWCVTRTMVYEFHDIGPRYFTDADRLAVRRGGIPMSHHFYIWTARYSGVTPFFAWPIPIDIQMPTGPSVAGHCATFTALRFAFQVLAYPASLALQGLPQRAGPWDRLIQIFPNQTTKTRVWPPTHELDHQDLDLFACRFLTPMVTARGGASKIIDRSL